MPYASKETITQIALDRWKTAKDPRTRQILTALVKHLHEFAREVELTEDEWLAGVQWLFETGKMSSENRNEFMLASDVLGLSMLVVMLNDRVPNGTTPNTVLGPFHIEESPVLEAGGDMGKGVAGRPFYVSGRVVDTDGKPIAGVELDVWQADGDGLYEAQHPNLNEPRLRALYKSGADGSYCLRTVEPLGYSIPVDGPVGGLIAKTAISPMRPSHIHFFINHPGYDRVITHLFKKGDRFIETDVVYGVKQELIVEFKQMPPGKTPAGDVSKEPFTVVHYDFVLNKSAASRKAGKAA